MNKYHGILKASWEDAENYSRDVFTGDYFCDHVKTYCDENLVSSVLNDRLLRQFFLYTRFPAHGLEKGEIICKGIKHELPTTSTNP